EFLKCLRALLPGRDAAGLRFWRDGRVVMQRPAKPCTPVRFRVAPPNNAGIAQLVERNLAKVEVASSNLVSRSKFKKREGFRSLPVFSFTRRPRSDMGTCMEAGQQQLGRAACADC